MSEPLQFRRAHPKEKKSGTKLLREQSQREWLCLHNPKKADRARETFRQERIYRHLEEGLSLSAQKEQEIHNNLMFCAPATKNKRTKARGNKFVKEVYNTARFPNAMEVLAKYDKDNRWAAGVNANTLMTEYRRKVLFHAYLDTGDVDEDRKDAQDKLKRYLQANHPDELKEEDRIGDKEALEREMAERKLEDSQDLSRADHMSMTGKYSNFINGSNDRMSEGGQTTTPAVRSLPDRINDPKCNFQPKWEDFDVMPGRWKYIKPELTSLLDRPSMAPTSISRQVNSPVSGSVVTGSFRDVIGYENNYEKSQARLVSVGTAREAKSVYSLSQRYSMASLSVPSTADKPSTDGASLGRVEPPIAEGNTGGEKR